MKSIKELNVNGVFPVAVMMLQEEGVEQHSQYDATLGVTLEIPEPVGVMYKNPCERVLFDPVRDSNPFLGFFEALWIIRGRNDVKFLTDIVPNMRNFSDDGVRYYGAYGYRLRHGAPGADPATGAGRDQIDEAIERLRTNHNDRQVVLTIRHPSDMWYRGKDQPCNLMVDCKIRDGKLNISVFNRSNDTVWGMLGTNVVQFSSLQEYIAGMVGVGVGTYHQITTSMHCYQNEQWEKIRDHINQNRLSGTDYYSQCKVHSYPMFLGGDLDSWNADLKYFFSCYQCQAPEMHFKEHFETPYFQEVVVPMWNALRAWKHYQEDRSMSAMSEMLFQAGTIKATDWQTAVLEWMKRRVK